MSLILFFRNKNILESFFYCFLQGFSSFCIVLLNKYVTSIWGFNYIIFILWFQFLLNLLIFIIFNSQFKKQFDINVTLFSFSIIKQVQLLSFVYLLNVFCGITGIYMNTIPIFNTLRRLVSLVILILDVLILSKKPSQRTIMGVGIMTMGAIIAGMFDLNGTQAGQFFIMMNNLLTALQFQLTSQLGGNKIDAFNMNYYNSLILFPITFMYLIIQNEFNIIYNDFEFIHYPAFWISLIFQSILGICIQLSQMLCNIKNSPLATSITGNIKDIVTTLVGLFIFGDVTLTFNLFIGILFSMAGALIYAHEKAFEIINKPKEIKIDDNEISMKYNNDSENDNKNITEVFVGKEKSEIDEEDNCLIKAGEGKSKRRIKIKN